MNASRSAPGPSVRQVTAPAARRAPPGLVERELLVTYAPAALVTDRQFAAMYFFGPIGRYLQVPTGASSQDLLALAGEALRPALQDVVERALRGKQPVTMRGIQLSRAGSDVALTLEARRIGAHANDLVLVGFIEEGTLSKHGAAARRVEPDSPAQDQLRQELREARDDLNRTVQDLRQQQQVEQALRAARAAADRASHEKTLLVAGAAHDLRQSLQTVRLLHAVLRRRAVDSEIQTVLGRLDDSVTSMTELLGALLEASELETGAITPDIQTFSVDQLLRRVTGELAPQAAAKGLRLHVVPCHASIRSDQRLLTRILNNLVCNAIKYTDRGGVLVGCRRRGDTLRIEVWDTGIGIPPEQLKLAFKEFRRGGNIDQRTPGTGLGLYIVQQCASVLDHGIDVRSVPGKGSMFAVTVGCTEPASRPPVGDWLPVDGTIATILLIQDDPDFLEDLLKMEGYRVLAVTASGEAAARLQAPDAGMPDAILCDYTIRGEASGLRIIEEVRAALDRPVPALLMSSDARAAALPSRNGHGLAVIAIPFRAAHFLAAVGRLLRGNPPKQAAAAPPAKRLPADGGAIAVIDDDEDVRAGLRAALEKAGYPATCYASAEAFLADRDRGRFVCLVADVGLPAMNGVELQRQLNSEQSTLPIIFASAGVDLPLAVEAMRAGAADLLIKPVDAAALLGSVASTLEHRAPGGPTPAAQQDYSTLRSGLTEREREVMDRVIHGETTKNIAIDLGISRRTAEHHRRNVMHKMGVRSLATLVHMATSVQMRSD